jgi:transposase-like protein
VPDFEKRWSRYALPVGDSWRVDETYLRVKGQWVYLYRAVDKQGRTVDARSARGRDRRLTRFLETCVDQPAIAQRGSFCR